MIVDEGLLRKLEQISLAATRVRVGQTAGERRSTKRGTSVEFADYRNYVRGDDLRRVDWNIYARLERPFVKLFEEEEDLAVHILLDGSGSMEWGGESSDPQTADLNKWLYARRLAAALGYVALVSGDRLTVVSLQSAVSPGSETGDWRFRFSRGRGHALRLFSWLEGLEAGGTTDLDGALRNYAVSGGRAGLVILISDLFSPAGYLKGVTSLAAAGHEVAVIHVLSPDEVEPPLGGDLRLLDVETGLPQEVSIDGGMRALYRRRLEEWQDGIRADCRARDVHYIPVETGTPYDHVVLYDLRRAGLAR
jgi:uncharacterized protein (DUF58 family)